MSGCIACVRKKKLSCCVFVCAVGFGVFVWYNVAVSFRSRRHKKQGDVLLFFIGAFVCQGGDTQKAHNVYYV